MQIGPALIVECPNCKGDVELMSLLSGNTIDGKRWWDLKEDYPMLPRLSYVQYCRHCHRMFMLAEARRKGCGKKGTIATGPLFFGQYSTALRQMKDKLEGNLRIQLYLEYIWAFNDNYQRENYRKLRPCPPEDLAEFQDAIREFVTFFPAKNRLQLAEFLREAKLFDEAMAIVEAEGEQTDENYKAFESMIREKCLAQDSTVGLVNRKPKDEIALRI